MSLDNIRIIMVRPIYGGNVGAVCRAMANMGFSDLALVKPRNINMDEARTMACHAVEVLDNRTEFLSLADAISDCGKVFGTTTRLGLYRQHVKTPREWARSIVTEASLARTAIVFGPEDNGLENEEIGMCSHLIRIPASPEYPSLNVAQAVLICLYEVFIESMSYVPPQEKSPEAPSRMKERMFTMWRQVLLKIGFMKEDKAEHMMLGIRRIFSRGKLTEDDVRILMGIARQMDWAAENSCRNKFKENLQKKNELGDNQALKSGVK